ncbi:MAG TPA: L-glutamate gamma-semialdehyde dehydrogenase [Xanthobacteraceae bacterium]|nr:L-glutamate gamma-semialdehyde dehydrogenase [Xanthobacteraceae bacterium]
MHGLAPFAAPYAEPDSAIATRLLAASAEAKPDRTGIETRARDLIGAIRAGSGGFGGVEELLREFSLSTKEGVALMVLAEALLRVPDAETADDLIEDKLAAGDFEHHETRSGSLLVNASVWALALSARTIQPGETPQGIIASLAKKIGLPTVRTAMRQAMRVMGQHFVFGETIEGALRRAAQNPRYRYSFDMLGEGARTAKDAARYRESYLQAIAAIGASAKGRTFADRPGISVKLSALHPRYEALSRERVLRELTPVLLQLAQAAKAHDLQFTVDAEEADRLELSLEVISAVFSDPSLAGWDGFGIAVQAYQKRASAVIAWFASLATTLGRRATIRLVKGAYWDTEIKRAQERGLDGYPVFTRKAMTDLHYEVCVRQLLALHPAIYPQFATHNALTVATVLDAAGGGHGFEFQRLHGMGEALYEKLLADDAATACRVYAPVGAHADLLAYLVRRLLENGANSSFASASADPEIPLEKLLRSPAENVNAHGANHPRIPLPRDLYGARQNSRGIEFGHRASLEGLLAEIEHGKPGNSASSATPENAITQALQAFPVWSDTAAETRAKALERAADLMEARRGRFLLLLQSEGKKTLDDALAEVREAIDFCRYYAAEARRLFANDTALPGPVGERNMLRLQGRGVFVAISPWNFPLAIFMGQITAALAAGNTVVAKSAEQTPQIAAEAVALLHEAEIPRDALVLVQGDGAAGAALTAHPGIAGVVFTGSTEVAQKINRTLAAKEGPIVPLIAETGGINAMIVDATALPEQVADDVITSAFRSAGQRCSALRVLLLPREAAEKFIAMIAGSAKELKLGDPHEIDTHVSPVIDEEARSRLDAHVTQMKARATTRYEGCALQGGTFVAPHIFQIESLDDLTEEIFGPILHVYVYEQHDLDAELRKLAKKGYRLTLGVHSRIERMATRAARAIGAGNVYVNRNMIGAVVGQQPFGGSGLSGTGPKAGGPHYLPRFATEQTITINTAAAGGDATLLAMAE